MGTFVRTPSGRIALILVLDRERGEALVRWPDNGEVARFRLRLLQPAPPTGGQPCRA